MCVEMRLRGRPHGTGLWQAEANAAWWSSTGTRCPRRARSGR